jgi:hypothetical protein
MNGLYVVAAVIGACYLIVTGLIVYTAIEIWRDRKPSGETLWLRASEKDPGRGYELAQAVRRYDAGARG